MKNKRTIVFINFPMIFKELLNFLIFISMFLIHILKIKRFKSLIQNQVKNRILCTVLVDRLAGRP